MALTGKTIGQLTYLSFPTNDTLIPVELSGDTFHISFSAVNYTELTYSDLVVGSQLGELSPGHYYLMTDYQTCYDQPNYNHNGNEITTGNYKTGSTEPLLLLATSTTGFSPTVFSTLYPKDKITYDITWNTTEVTNSPAKGRITERIDADNNRTDYDFRAVQFIRYHGFFSEDVYVGKVSIDGTGLVTGVGTTFTSTFSPGSIVGIKTAIAPMSCFVYYEVSGITNDTSMVVVGKTIIAQSDTYYAFGLNLPTHSSPFQCNISGNTYSGFSEYYTFEAEICTNNYIGNNATGTFVLSNNVFKSGSYRDNSFGGNSVGNTFDDDMDSNTCGPFFSYNIITNDFDDNQIGPSFSHNIIDCDFQNNVIGDVFQNNMIGDEDGDEFNNNVIGPQFQYNYITIAGVFDNNNIGQIFTDNIIDVDFQNNTIIGNFNNNFLKSGGFEDNTVGHTCYNNFVYASVLRNNLGTNFYNNFIYSVISDNTIGSDASVNLFGDPNNFGFYTFNRNIIGSNFTNNIFSGDTQGNTIGYGCDLNNIDTNFSQNKIGNGFTNNTIANDFGFGGGNYRGNIVGNGFNNNTIGEYCYDNTFGDECFSNNLPDYFTNNKISFGMNNTTIVDLDSAGNFQNNNFTYGYFSNNLTLTGGTGGNPIFYTDITTNVIKDASDSTGYVTFLSGGTIISQTITI